MRSCGHEERLRARSIIDCGAEWFTWLGAGDDKSCEYCARWDGSVRRIKDLNVEAHFANCSNPLGCRCVCGPVLIGVSYRKTHIYKSPK